MDEEPSWYGKWSEWSGLNPGGGAMLRSFMAEAAGAGTVAADADVVEWHGGGGRQAYDGTADGRRFDVKRAWLHRDNGIAFGGPGAGDLFDPALVDDIVLTVTENEDLSVSLEYQADGAVELRARLRPRAVYVTPIAVINELMWRDGRSRARWIVDSPVVWPYLRREARPAPQ